MPVENLTRSSNASETTSFGKSRFLWLIAVTVAVFAVFFMATTLIGATRWIHPVPFWDMWDGYLAFWFELQDGNSSLWLQFSNEHNLLLLKAIFWLDLTLFSGSQTFLVGVNMLLTAGIATALITMLYQRLSFGASRNFGRATFVALSSTLVIVTFSWMQGDQFVFPYHAHFLMNILAPLLVFAMLGIAAQRNDDERPGVSMVFWLAFSAALLAPWTAASGVFVPFLAAALAALIGLGYKRALALLALGVVGAVIYSTNSLLANPGEDGPISNFLASPLDVFRFLLVYLGGPWATVTDSRIIGGVAGGFFILVVVVAVFSFSRRGKRSISGLTVLSYPVFLVITGALTAAGRIQLGFEQVTAIRYLTPVLAGWSCLLILASPWLLKWFTRPLPLASLTLLLIPILLLPDQLSALTPNQGNLHLRDTATLAVSLGVRDPASLYPIYPWSMEKPIELGARAREEGITVLAREPYASLLSTMGLPPDQAKADVACAGWIESRTSIDGSPWERVDGWVVVSGSSLHEKVLRLTNRMTETVGWVTVGNTREDVRSLYQDATGIDGFSGYLRADVSSENLAIAGDSYRCSEPLTVAVG